MTVKARWLFTHIASSKMASPGEVSGVLDVVEWL
jgi:hypothetical protein